MVLKHIQHSFDFLRVHKGIPVIDCLEIPVKLRSTNLSYLFQYCCKPLLQSGFSLGIV